jgi:hypothetical protein
MRCICSILLVILVVHEAHADVLENTKRAMRILDRIASAAGTGFVKPAIIVGSSPGLASYSSDRKLITIDSGMFRAADRLGSRANAVLAAIIGHEYAHYVRGHNYNDLFQHKFGGYSSIRNANTSNSRLLLGKQNENEADYFGTYYALLAGYDIQVSDLVAYQAELKLEYGAKADEAVFVDDVHQSDGERAQVAKAVIDEMRQNVLLHHGANVALMSGDYLQAAVLYEFVCRHVNIPSVNWNELLARYLFLQKMSDKELVDPKVLRTEYVAEFRYRSGDQNLKLDVEQTIYRCRALLEILRASGFNAERVSRFERLISAYEESNACQQCSNGRVCSAHLAEGKKVESEFALEATLAGGAAVIPSNFIDAAGMMNVSKEIDSYAAANRPQGVNLSIGRASIVSVEREGATYLRIQYLRPKSRVMQRIDMEVRLCPTCDYTMPVQQDNLIVQNLGGKVIRAASFVD